MRPHHHQNNNKKQLLKCFSIEGSGIFCLFFFLFEVAAGELCRFLRLQMDKHRLEKGGIVLIPWL